MLPIKSMSRPRRVMSIDFEVSSSDGSDKPISSANELFIECQFMAHSCTLSHDRDIRVLARRGVLLSGHMSGPVPFEKFRNHGRSGTTQWPTQLDATPSALLSASIDPGVGGWSSDYFAASP